jgi:hypothetical protein
MGHDITAYIKTKDSMVRFEVAYFRISAFNELRNKLFYGTLNGSDEANGGVSGTGVSITFRRKEIETAKEACKYYLNDIDALREYVLNKHSENVDNSVKKFKEIITLVFGDNMEESDVQSEESIEEIKENLVDIIVFHNKILNAYDEAASKNNIEIIVDFY